MIEETLGSYGNELISAFFDPSKRIFWGYLLSAGVIAVFWLILSKGHSLPEACRRIFARNVWWSRSARADYRVMALNSAIMLILSPQLLSQLGVSVLVFEWMHGLFGGRPTLLPELPDWTVVMAFTFCLFVIDDFAKYAVHRLLHEVPVLWSFHKVHHTATSLSPLTVYRTHPVEGVVFILRGAVVHGFCTAVFVFFFGSQVTLASVLGAGVFTFVFNAVGSNLRHSHIALGYWKPLERIFISPAQHQIHHSTAEMHIDRNYGAALAIWDWLFGTHCFSQTKLALRFGVKGETGPETHTLSALYWRPFKDAARAIGRLRVLQHGLPGARVEESRMFNQVKPYRDDVASRSLINP